MRWGMRRDGRHGRAICARPSWESCAQQGSAQRRTANFQTVQLSAIKLWMHTFGGQSPVRGDG